MLGICVLKTKLLKKTNCYLKIKCGFKNLSRIGGREALSIATARLYRVVFTSITSSQNFLSLES